jgi:hypothetical protein
VCHISLKSYQRGLQLFFRPHLNKRSEQEIMSVQSDRSPNFENFGIPNLEILRKMTFECSPHGESKMYYNGEGGGFPTFKLWWVLWVCVCPWFIYAPKMLQLCINQLVVWFVQIHMNNWLACHLSSSPS